jgi:hypothetical protein
MVCFPPFMAEPERDHQRLTPCWSNCSGHALMQHMGQVLVPLGIAFWRPPGTEICGFQGLMIDSEIRPERPTSSVVPNTVCVTDTHFSAIHDRTRCQRISRHSQSVFRRITDRPAASVGIAQESYGRGCPLIVALPELLYSRRRERSQPGL